MEKAKRREKEEGIMNKIRQINWGITLKKEEGRKIKQVNMLI